MKKKTKEETCRIWNGFSSFYFKSSFKISLFFDNAPKTITPYLWQKGVSVLLRTFQYIKPPDVKKPVTSFEGLF